MSSSPVLVTVHVDLEPFRRSLTQLQQATNVFRYTLWERRRHRWQEGPEFWPPALRDVVGGTTS